MTIEHRVTYRGPNNVTAYVPEDVVHEKRRDRIGPAVLYDPDAHRVIAHLNGEDVA